ncbi:MAG: ATP-binding cassette domain-containing protein [Bryobacteraceae bacterium]|jgi:phospholipid/cholesterol/gamma-HCH transport system ATP-binding protein
MENTDNSLPIAIAHLSKSFGGQKVLEGIDLTISRGQTVSLIGRSGTGKSVLLRLLVGLDQPDSGSIRIDGEEITSLDMDQLNKIRQKLGFLFQQAALYDSLTLGENVEFPLKRQRKLAPPERKDKVHQLLASVGLEGDVDKFPSEISGGMKKRAGLARALALDPAIVFFDEPTAGLDPITAAEIGQLITELGKQRGMTSVVATHDMHSVRCFSDRAVLLDKGKVLIDGSFDDLQNSSDPFVAEFLSDAT